MAWREFTACCQRTGVPDDRHRLVIADAMKKAFAMFALLHDKVLKLVALLVENGRIDRPEFAQLMDQG